MNPLSLLKSLGSSQISFLDPLLQTSFALGTEMRKAGLLPNKGYAPAYGGPIQKPLNAIQTGKYGPSDWNPSANPKPVLKEPPPSLTDTPAQRAQNQERSRVAQMTEQDPLFKKYRVAELTKAYNTASPEDKEKIGLEIWATTNPQLAQKLKPGQLGYTQATSAVMSQSPLGQFQAQTGDMQYANKMDQVPDAMAGFQPQTPLTGILTPATPQFGASEVFAKATPIPGATEMFTDPRKFLSQEELSQTQLALLKKAIESRIK